MKYLGRLSGAIGGSWLGFRGWLGGNLIEGILEVYKWMIFDEGFGRKGCYDTQSLMRDFWNERDRYLDAWFKG